MGHAVHWLPGRSREGRPLFTSGADRAGRRRDGATVIRTHCQLLETARLLINREEILSRAVRRHTKRPGSRPIRRIGIRITQRGMPLFIVSHVQPDKLLEISIRIENLNTSVAAISDVHISLFVYLHGI